MMQPTVYQTLVERKQKGVKSIAALVDPDKVSETASEMLEKLKLHRPDFIFWGGSLITSGDNEQKLLKRFREELKVPVVLFPGNSIQINAYADAILFLSLISGRNPEYLIGQHVVAAPYLKKSSLEVISTGYLLIDSGRPTTASYMSHTLPIPSNKPEIAACTAMAGEMLGMKLMYLDGGSGAARPVPREIIKAVRKSVNTPLIVGGGINSEGKINEAFNSGADVVVIGTAFERNDVTGIPLRTTRESSPIV